MVQNERIQEGTLPVWPGLWLQEAGKQRGTLWSPPMVRVPPFLTVLYSATLSPTQNVLLQPRREGYTSSAGDARANLLKRMLWTSGWFLTHHREGDANSTCPLGSQCMASKPEEKTPCCLEDTPMWWPTPSIKACRPFLSLSSPTLGHGCSQSIEGFSPQFLGLLWARDRRHCGVETSHPCGLLYLGHRAWIPGLSVSIARGYYIFTRVFGDGVCYTEIVSEHVLQAGLRKKRTH